MLGEILIGGMASLLICVFVGPRFIDYLRLREFGQHIREEGPAGHQGKAGTPTMGGLAVLLAVLVPFLILSDYRQASLAVLGTTLAMAALGFADDWTKLRKRRSLGVSGRTKLVIQAITAIGLWLATDPVGLQDTLRLRFVDVSVDLGIAYPVLIFLVLAGATNGVILIGGIFVIEALSVAIQVFAFQRFRKRVFLMAPIHHHFELLGWSETKIILRFWIVAAICAAIGFTLYQQSITP